MNDFERAQQFKENLLCFYDTCLHPEVMDDKSFSEERTYFMKKYLKYAPIFLRNVRSINDFNNHLRNVASWSWSYQARRNFINDSFKNFLFFLEFWNSNSSEYDIKQWNILLSIDEELYEHIKLQLDKEDYYHAIEESYKFVREKLKQLTWEEQWHKAFSKDNYDKIFWYTPKEWTPEWDFCEWVKLLNIAIQNFRNENFHTLGREIDKNKAMHFIVLSSLAYKLITNR